MTKLELDFFEEYKRLDALCRDLLAARENEGSGVGKYESAMTELTGRMRDRIPGWNEDRRMLYRVRTLRNLLSHTSEATDCCEDDLAFVREFHQRILKQRDPLALARQAAKKTARARTAKAEKPSRRAGKNTRSLRGVYALIGVMAVLLVIALVLLFTLWKG